ncbi:MAG: radical SAM protein [Phycisphaerales bacterium]|nr:radical SAM protein [Phycisphaerales bacterium]MCB9856960.1 radical SAM protein [Phycisphaerales bacterium]MCB9861913.1 radical SAM protein [Phycisphaerales bacterium]
MTQSMLNIADLHLRSRVNGPGVRTVVWVQGCTIGCPGCFNPHTHMHEVRRLVDPRELGDWIAGDEHCDGLTISGGEPFEQGEACALLASTVGDAGKSVMVFSGYRFDVLKNSPSPDVKQFLEAIDLLVAGPYVAGMPGDPATWRGSGNQTVHHLTDRLRGPKSESLKPVVELRLDGEHLRASGFPDPEDRRWIEAIASLR